MHHYAHQGLIPLCLHLDGAEMFTNNEFMVWSIQSVFANGTDVWDSKFPVCFIPLESMRDQDVRDAVHQSIAELWHGVSKQLQLGYGQQWARKAKPSLVAIGIDYKGNN